MLLAWLLVLFFVPLALIVGVSFLTRDELGRFGLPLTIDNYPRLVGFGLFGFDPIQPLILLRSLAMGLLTAVVCGFCGLPLALFIARLPLRWRNVALMLVVIPFWTNLLIRTTAVRSQRRLALRLGHRMRGPPPGPGRLVVSAAEG